MLPFDDSERKDCERIGVRVLQSWSGGNQLFNTDGTGVFETVVLG
jgi:hypothetical protein